MVFREDQYNWSTSRQIDQERERGTEREKIQIAKIRNQKDDTADSTSIKKVRKEFYREFMPIN